MIAILTKELKDGWKLKETLKSLNCEFDNVECLTKEDILISNKIKNIEKIFSTWYMPEFTEEEVKKYFPSLKAIFYAAGTVKYFAEPFLKNGIKVYTASKANGISVAEFVAAQIILANKGYYQAQKEYKKHLWKFSFLKARSIAESKSGNYKTKIGIIGCGIIGSEVVRLLKSYKLDVYVYDPYLSDTNVTELGVKRTSLEEIVSTCDVISNHLPDLHSTKDFFNYSLLSKMKDNATFINSGRGNQVVERDLAKVLKKKPNACALLDVTRHEPLFPWSPLLRRKNIFITPHIAGSLSGGEFDRMVEFMVSALKDFEEGRKNDCEVSLYQLYKQA